jgi:hypothetical protein
LDTAGAATRVFIEVVRPNSEALEGSRVGISDVVLDRSESDQYGYRWRFLALDKDDDIFCRGRLGRAVQVK